MATTVARLEAILSADTRDFDRGMKRSETTMGKVGKVAGLAGAAIIGGLAVGLKSSVGAAKDAQVAQLTLNQALATAGISQAKYGKEIDANIQRTSKLAALDDEDLSNAFSQLVRTTGSVTKATAGMNLAADIARSRHVSLASATKAVEKAYNGSEAALKRFGIAIPKVTDASDALKENINLLKDKLKGATKETKAKIQADIDTLKASMNAAKASDKQATATEAITEAQRKFSGGAATYGKSGAAASERFQVAIENLQESLGTMLLPALTRVSNAAARMATFFEEHTTVTKLLVAAIAALGGVLITVSVATKAWTAIQLAARAAAIVWTAAQWLLNAALTANPIGVVVVALTALVAGLILAYQKSETFRAIVQGAFDAVNKAATTVLNFFRDNWKTIATLLTGPFAPIVALATDAFGIRSALTNAFTGIINWVRDHWKEIATVISGPFAPIVALATNSFGIRDALLGAFDKLLGLMKPKAEAMGSIGTWIKNAIIGGLEGIVKGISSIITTALNYAIELINKLIAAYNAIPIAPNIPKIPKIGDDVLPPGLTGPTRARGGPVRAGSAYLVGERGPEMFVPGASGTIVPNGAAGATYNFSFPNYVGSKDELIRVVREGLIEIGRRNSGGALGGFA